MVQRLQSLYLLLAAVSLLLLLFFDLAWTSPAAAAYAWFTPVVLIFAGLLAVAALVTIFLYGDRVRQKRIVELLQYGTLLFMVVLFGGMYAAGDLHFLRDGEVSTGKIVSMLAPVFAYLLLFLARRGIVHDINLVRSMDRLR